MELDYRFGMPWATPQYSKTQVDAAGKVLIDQAATPDDLAHALTVINNWRASHSFPLNTFQNTLRDKAGHVDTQSLISQRIKRLAAIQLKLRLQPTMKLSQMQDIGGCRAVPRSLRGVYRLLDSYTKRSRLKHNLRRVTDYIQSPRDSGYRSLHLIYQFQGRAQAYIGLQIEVQIRSQLQHAWATAVETVGTFLRQALKSSQGEEAWLRFFALMGSALALRERTPLVRGTPTTKEELTAELRQAVTDLQVEPKLSGYRTALNMMTHKKLKGSKYFLLDLDAAKRQLNVTGFNVNQLEQATAEYLETEKAIADRPGAEAVLVSVRSVTALRRAYPSYFLDTRRFLQAVEQATKE